MRLDIFTDANRSTMSRPILHQNLNRLQAPLLKRDNQQDPQIQISSLVRCEKKRATEKVSLVCDLLSDKWGNLDPNILGKIFSRLPVIDLFLSVASVCQTWEAECLDFLFWSRNILDMSATGAGFSSINSSAITRLFSAQAKRVPFFFGAIESKEMYDVMATKLMRMLKRIMEGDRSTRRCSMQDWIDSIQTVILPFDLEISDTHLLYIAERTLHIQHLLLLCPSRITGKGINKAMKYWRNVKEMHLGSLNEDQFTQFIEEIGRNCQDVEFLHIHQKKLRIDQTSASIIARNLPRLKKLELEFCYVLSSGLATMYNMCLNLEVVYFKCCYLNHESYPSIGFDPYYSCPYSFQVKWTVGNGGFAKWKVKASSIDVELFEKEVELFKEEIMQPASVEECQEFMDKQVPLDFLEWIAYPLVIPRR